MAKDPAALFYIANFLVATAEMKADCTGWYVRLILHQYEKKSLPNDVEELANLANVRASEFEVFQQVWQQVLKHKFKVLPTNRLVDEDAAEIIRAREAFVDKRAAAGRKSAFIKMIRRELCQDENVIHYIKTHVKDEQIETKDQQVLKQVFKQMFQLYINIDINTNKERKEDDVRGVGEEEGGREGFSDWKPPEGPPWPERASQLPQAMLKIFTDSFPGYPRQQDNDLPACLQLGYAIAELHGWPSQSALNGRLAEVLSEWKEIVAFIKTSKWFRTKPLSFLAENFQGLIQAKNDAGNDEQPNRNRNAGNLTATGSPVVQTFVGGTSRKPWRD